MYQKNPLVTEAINIPALAVGTTVSAMNVGAIMYGRATIKKLRSLRASINNCQTIEEVVATLNRFFEYLKLDANKIKDPKSQTIWKRLWTAKANWYHFLNQSDDIDVIKEKIDKMLKSNIIQIKILIGVTGATGAVAAGVTASTAFK